MEGSPKTYNLLKGFINVLETKLDFKTALTNAITTYKFGTFITMYEVTKWIINIIILLFIITGFLFFADTFKNVIAYYKPLQQKEVYIYFFMTFILIILFVFLKPYSDPPAYKTKLELYKDRFIRLAHFFYGLPLKLFFIFICIYFLAIYLFWIFSFWFEINVPAYYYPILFIVVMLFLLNSVSFFQLFLGFIVYYFVKNRLIQKQKSQKSKKSQKNQKSKKSQKSQKALFVVFGLILATLFLFYFDSVASVASVRTISQPKSIDKNVFGVGIYIFFIFLCIFVFDLLKQYLDKQKINKQFNIGLSDYGTFPSFSFIKGWKQKNNNIWNQFITTFIKFIIFVFLSPTFLSVFIITMYLLLHFTIKD